MRNKKTILVLLMAALMLIPSGTAMARGSSGHSSGGGGSKGASSGGTKSPGSSGTKGSGSGGTKSYGSSGTKPTLKAPSSGSKPLPHPITKAVPATPPPSFSNPVNRPKYVPSSANWSRDRNTLTNGSYTYGGRRVYYSDPYGPRYFGYYNSPLSYLWVYSWLDGDRSNNEPAPESDEEVDTSLLSFMQVIQAMQEQTAGKGQ